MGDLNGRLPAVKAWDDGTTEMEQNCVPMWHLGCEAINALEAELAARDEALTIAYRFALQTHWEDLRKHLEPFSLDLRARAEEGGEE